MTRYGLVSTYWSKDWGIDYFEVLQNASKADINCIEFRTMPTLEWPEKQIRDFVKMAEDLDIEIILNGGPGADMWFEDPEIRQLGLDRMTMNLRHAAKFGIKLYDGGYSEGTWPSKPGRILTMNEKKIMTERVIEGIKKMVRIAEDLGITMTMEIVNRFEGFLVNTSKEARYIAESVDSPNFKITLDTYHMNIEEDSIESGINIIGKEYLGLVHLGESNRKLPGQGAMIDWDKVFKGLKAIGYHGILLLEPFMLTGGMIAQSVHLWRDLTDGASKEQLTEMLKKSVAFVKSKWGK